MKALKKFLGFIIYNLYKYVYNKRFIFSYIIYEKIILIYMTH